MIHSKTFISIPKVTNLKGFDKLIGKAIACKSKKENSVSLEYI